MVDYTVFRVGLRVIGMAVFLYAAAAAVFGKDLLPNPLFGMVYVWWWVGPVPQRRLRLVQGFQLLGALHPGPQRPHHAPRQHRAAHLLRRGGRDLPVGSALTGVGPETRLHLLFAA